MPKGLLMFIAGIASIIPALTTVVITAVRCKSLQGWSSSSSTRSNEWGCLAFSVTSCIVIFLLTFRLAEECKTTSREWQIWDVRVRTIFSMFLFISMCVVAGEMAAGNNNLQTPNQSAWSNLAAISLGVPQTILWTISAYFQGCLCTLSLVLSNIRSNRHRASMSSVTRRTPTSSPGDPSTPLAFEFRYRCKSSPAEPSLTRFPPRLWTPTRARPWTEDDYLPQFSFGAMPKNKMHPGRIPGPNSALRPAASLDDMLSQDLSSPPRSSSSARATYAYSKHSGPSSLPSFESLPTTPATVGSSNVIIHPLFRPNSPTRAPTPTSGTSITAAPGAGQTISLEEFKLTRSSSSLSCPAAAATATGSASRTVDEKNQPEQPSSPISPTSPTTLLTSETPPSEEAEASARTGTRPRTRPGLPKFIWDAGLRNSFLRFNKEKRSKDEESQSTNEDCVDR